MKADDFIQYSDVKQGGEFQRLHPKCQQIAYVASFLAKTLFNETLICTSIYRKKTSDSGIHEAFRAIDFKPLKNITDTYRLLEIINSIFTYDPLRPDKKCAHPNPFHGTAPHIHLQSHDSTVVTTVAQNMGFLTLASKDSHDFKPLNLA